jgi:hypothetical protein
MSKSLGIYCFSKKQLKIEKHARPSPKIEFIDLRNEQIFKYRDQYQRNKKDYESEFLWRIYSVLHDSGSSYNYCYKFKSYNSAKLLNFRIIYDTVKICNSNDSYLLEKIQGLYSRMVHINQMEENIASILENASFASGDNDGHLNEIGELISKLIQVKSKMKEAIPEELNEYFCKF